MSFKRVILPGFMLGLVVVLLAVGTAYYGFLPDKLQRSIYEESGFGPKPDEPDPSTAPPPAFTKADTTRLAKSLNSPTRAGQANALIPALRDGKWDPKKVLPEGTNLTLKPDTFRKAKDGDHTVQATATGTKTASFLLHLAAEDNQWLITRTERTDTKTQSSHPKPEQDTTSGGISPQLGAARPLSEDTPQCATNFGTKVPVLMVHGFNSDGEMWRKSGAQSMAKALSELSGVEADYFDYKESHLEWVTNPNIGPKLADHIRCLSDASKKGGGQGKVVIVAHSMGGLAARYALAQLDMSGRVGLVITMGTPHSGSDLARLCLDGIVPATACDGTASRALTSGSKELKELPPFPSGVLVRAVAGRVMVSTPMLFDAVTIDMEGDKVVKEKSATAYYTETGKGDGKHIFVCRGTSVIPGSDAPCEHNVMVDTPYIQDSVVKGIKEYLEATQIPTRTFHGLSVPMSKGWEVTHSDARTTIIRDVNRCNTQLDSSMEEFRERIEQDKLWCAGMAITDLTKSATEGTDGYYCESTTATEQTKIDGMLATYKLQANCSNGIVVGTSAVKSWHVPTKKIVIDVYDLPGNPFIGASEAIERSRWATAS